MISTVTMIKLGYVKGNRMTNVKPANEKLRDRSVRILMAETNLEEAAAKELIQTANGDIRVAILMHRTDSSFEDATQALTDNNFVIEKAVVQLDN